MPWPRPRNFGVVDNPLVETPFVAGSRVDTSAPPPAGNNFLLLGGGNFLLLNGNNLALL